MLQKKVCYPPYHVFGVQRYLGGESADSTNKFSIDEIVSVLTFHKYLIGQRGKY